MNRAPSHPSIAVVVLSYRRPDFIGETIDSLVRQDGLSRWVSAVYLADDCSPDETVTVAQRHWRVALPLQLLSPTQNAGTWGNVNQALTRLSERHDWVLVLHDDDLVKPHWIEQMCEAIHSAPAHVGSICSSWDDLHVDGRIENGEDNPARAHDRIEPGDTAVAHTLRVGCWWHFSGCAIRTQAFTAIGGFDPAYQQCGDQEWLLRALAHGWGVIYIPRTLLVYRYHIGSLSSHSLAKHQDVREQVWMLQRFGGALTAGGLLKLHSRLANFLIRRLGRAVLSRRWVAGTNAIRLLPTVAGSLVGRLVQRRGLAGD